MAAIITMIAGVGGVKFRAAAVITAVKVVDIILLVMMGTILLVMMGMME